MSWHSDEDAQNAALALVVRVCFAMALFGISGNLPFLENLQHSVPGFWNFAMDGVVGHQNGVAISQAWASGSPVPIPGSGETSYYFLVAAIYRFLGPNPLFPIMLNCLASALQVFFLAKIVRRIGSPRGASAAAWTLCFWPSHVLWATQVMKDALCGLGVLAPIYFALEARYALGINRKASLLTIVVLATISATLFRFYTGVAIALPLLAFFGVAFVKDAMTRWRRLTFEEQTKKDAYEFTFLLQTETIKRRLVSREWVVFVTLATLLFIGNGLAANWEGSRGRELVVSLSKEEKKKTDIFRSQENILLEQRSVLADERKMIEVLSRRDRKWQGELEEEIKHLKQTILALERTVRTQTEMFGSCPVSEPTVDQPRDLIRRVGR